MSSPTDYLAQDIAYLEQSLVYLNAQKAGVEKSIKEKSERLAHMKKIQAGTAEKPPETIAGIAPELVAALPEWAKTKTSNKPPLKR